MFNIDNCSLHQEKDKKEIVVRDCGDNAYVFNFEATMLLIDCQKTAITFVKYGIIDKTKVINF